MCLPFLCGGHEDHGSTAHNDTRQQPQHSDHGDPPYEPIAVAPSPLKGGYVVGGKNGGAGGNAVPQPQGRRAADAVNKNGETGAAFVNNSDSDAPASVGVGLRGRKGATEKIAVASPPARQAHGGQMEPKVMAPTTTTPRAPDQRKEHVAPVQQVARRDEEDSPPPHPSAAAASDNFKR